MPALIVALIGALATAAGSIVGRVLLALGMGFVSYTGISALLEFVVNYLQSSIAGLPGITLQVLGVLQFDTCVGILVSAVTVRMILDGLQGGAIKRLVVQ